MYFLSVGVQCPLLSDVQCFQDRLVFCLFCVVVSGVRGSLCADAVQSPRHKCHTDPPCEMGAGIRELGSHIFMTLGQRASPNVIFCSIPNRVEVVMVFIKRGLANLEGRANVDKWGTGLLIG